MFNAVRDMFVEIQEQRGVGLLQYPSWAVRRFVADQVAWEAARFDPRVRADVDEAWGGREGLFEEDAGKDERLVAVLRRHHLDGVVMIVENLSEEPETA